MPIPKRVSKEVLKSHMLEFFRAVERTGKDLKRQPKRTKTVFKPYRHRVVYYEDITAPTTDEWKEI